MHQGNLFGQPGSNAYGGALDPVAAGREAADACSDRAVGQGWNIDGATAFILAYLRDHGPTPGETLVTEANKVYPAEDTRAYGSIFGRLRKAGRIKFAGFVERAKGHGTAGGRVWELVQETTP